MARSRPWSERGQVVPRRVPVKAVWTWPPRGCGGRGAPMEIQLLGEAEIEACRGCGWGAHSVVAGGWRLARAKKVWLRNRGLTKQMERIWRGGKVQRCGACPKHVEFCSWRKSFHCRSGDHRRRTKLNFQQRVSRSMIFIGPAHLGPGIKIRSFFGGGSMFFGKRFLGLRAATENKVAEE